MGMKRADCGKVPFSAISPLRVSTKTAYQAMITQEYIHLHISDDPATLALKGAPEGVDMPYALRQIEGRQTAMKKLPRWAAQEGIVYPVRLSMQQCSSEQAAAYKGRVAGRLAAEHELRSMIDLTGGLGVDFVSLAPLFHRSRYVERDEALCEAARNNFPLLGIQGSEVVCADAMDMLDSGFDFAFIDPARRDGVGRKLVRIEDCQPDVALLQDRLLATASVVMAKLSPMLDITQALRTLRHVAEVHVVAAEGECKELLLVMVRGHSGEPAIYCEGLKFTRTGEAAAMPQWADRTGRWLYVPSPAVMKAAPFRLLSATFKLKALQQDTHLYTSDDHVEGFPGRTFLIRDVCDVKTFKRQHPDIEAANILCRAYPDTPDNLRRRLKLRDGGGHYLVATTLPGGHRALLLCERYTGG